MVGGTNGNDVVLGTTWAAMSGSYKGGEEMRRVGDVMRKCWRGIGGGNEQERETCQTPGNAISQGKMPPNLQRTLTSLPAHTHSSTMQYMAPHIMGTNLRISELLYTAL